MPWEIPCDIMMVHKSSIQKTLHDFNDLNSVKSHE